MWMDIKIHSRLYLRISHLTDKEGFSLHPTSSIYPPPPSPFTPPPPSPSFSSFLASTWQHIMNKIHNKPGSTSPLSSLLNRQQKSALNYIHNKLRFEVSILLLCFGRTRVVRDLDESFVQHLMCAIKRGWELQENLQVAQQVCETLMNSHRNFEHVQGWRDHGQWITVGVQTRVRVVREFTSRSTNCEKLSSKLWTCSRLTKSRTVHDNWRSNRLPY